MLALVPGDYEPCSAWLFVPVPGVSCLVFVFPLYHLFYLLYEPVIHTVHTPQFKYCGCDYATSVHFENKLCQFAESIHQHTRT